MLRLPQKNSLRWLPFFACYTLAIFILMTPTRLLLQVHFSAQALLGIATLAVLSATVACLAGYWGWRLAFIGTTVGIVAGLAIMYQTSLFNSTPSWSDLSTIVSYTLMTLLGAVIGALADGIRAVLLARRDAMMQ